MIIPLLSPPLLSLSKLIWVFFLPQFQDASRVHRWVDPAHKVEVPDIEAAIGAHCQGDRRQQLVAVCQAVTAGAGDTAPPAVSHDAGDYWGLLRHKDVLAASLVKDAWTAERVEVIISVTGSLVTV